MDSLHPKIFTIGYFESALKTILGIQETPKIIKLLITPCSGFLSSLYRVPIIYQRDKGSKSTQEISIIVKSESLNDFALTLVGKNGFDVQTKEVKFYKKVAPEMLKILDAKIFPKIFRIDDENKVLFLEDLNESNFTMADKMVGFDEQHMIISLQKIAKFHAASLKVLENDPKSFQDFRQGMFSRTFDQFDVAIMAFYQAAVEEIASWEGYAGFARDMLIIKDNIMEKVKSCFDLKENEFNVLNHGDLWTTNVMFKYRSDGKTVRDAILIDFQFSHLGSAALDIVHFLFTSLSSNLYNPRDIYRLVTIYHKMLLENVTKYKCNVENVPKIEEFIEEFNRKLIFGFVYTTCILPVMTTDDPDNDFTAHYNFDDRSNAFRKRVMKAEKYQKIVKEMLPFFDKMGIIGVNRGAEHGREHFLFSNYSSLGF